MNHGNVVKRLSQLMLLCLALLFAVSCRKTQSEDESLSDADRKKFEQEAYDLRCQLIHEHTYDKANLPKADSLYNLAVKYNSDYGKKEALQVKYYVYIADTAQSENFEKTIDEFLQLVSNREDKADYFDGMNAKLYYYMSHHKYMTAQYMIRDVMSEAERSGDSTSLYFANYQMANFYQNRSNYSIALPYLLKAEKYVWTDSVRMSLINRELSIIYSNLGNYNEALKRAEISRRYAPTTVHKIWGEHQYLSALFGLGQYDHFTREWQNSILHDNQTNGILPHYMQLQLQIDEAICQKDWNTAERYANEIEYENIRMNELLNVYYAKKDFEKAYQIKTRLDEQKDSIQTAMQTEDLNEMDARLGNSLLKLQSQQWKSRNQRNIFIGIIFILIIISFAVAYTLRKNRKHLQILNKKNEELKQAREVAEKASQIKSVFLGNMSHEFFTPLNHISGFAQILADENIPLEDAQTRKMAEVIVNSSEHLNQVLNNIITVTDKLSGMTNLEDVESILSEAEYKEYSQNSESPE